MFRALPSFQFKAEAYVQLMREFGWKQMVMIFQEEVLFSKVSTYEAVASQITSNFMTMLTAVHTCTCTRTVRTPIQYIVSLLLWALTRNILHNYVNTTGENVT